MNHTGIIETRNSFCIELICEVSDLDRNWKRLVSPSRNGQDLLFHTNLFGEVNHAVPLEEAFLSLHY